MDSIPTLKHLTRYVQALASSLLDKGSSASLGFPAQPAKDINGRRRAGRVHKDLAASQGGVRVHRVAVHDLPGVLPGADTEKFFVQGEGECRRLES